MVRSGPRAGGTRAGCRSELRNIAGAQRAHDLTCIRIFRIPVAPGSACTLAADEARTARVRLGSSLPPPACPPCWEPASYGESPCPGPSSRFLFRAITIVAMAPCCWRPAVLRPPPPAPVARCSPGCECCSSDPRPSCTADATRRLPAGAALGARLRALLRPGRLGSHRAAARSCPVN
jgi:hypothetical protein